MPAAHETAGRSIASASEFIPVAEQFGLAKLVDHRALELAVELLRSMPEIKLALNVSAATATDRNGCTGSKRSPEKTPVWPRG